MGVLDGKVVLVTGGANGIGRECALLAGRAGAKVVVNDLGAGVSGRDDDSVETAEGVVREIRAGGGEAVSNGESVASYGAVERMVAQALDSFGRIDAVINPAGILRDGMFHKMREVDWDAVVEVHLRGAFNVSRAVVELFREQGGGSFVHFTSTSGLIGNLGQANYAAAKMGVVGLSRILAMEGAVKGVRSNVIAPFAWTRMIATIPVTDEASAQRVERMRTGMRADQVAQLAIALAADAASDVTGQIFAVRGNEVILFNQPRPVASVARSDGWTPETLLSEALGALKPKFTDIGASATVFPYDPV
ncbi:SDR family NAD(P)-dependent oxidoreductase [Sphingobium sp. TKS]|uniref:SDR family NAD(P)-dependent oxidoreductase n=1 Tax=Sphingobium sp. TKS TaxID=1315974 RepID=UPI0007701931|nr:MULTISPECIES: SDR family NAD(P)-dependent oxidoreductase [Sphingomonadaceae]AMK24167.1 short chain dehydrogenase/reductase family oxidoreductase [Sphingobium sp. TKS]